MVGADPAEARLLAEIDADPDADEPRQVYADLLVERGDPRGELIQLQCAAAQLPEGDDRREELADHADRLRGANPGWDRELTDIPGVSRPRWRRGFVEGVDLEWHHAEAALEEVRRRAPLRDVRFLVTSPVARQAPDLRGLRGLEARARLSREEEADVIGDLLAGSDLSALRELDTGLGYHGAMNVAAAAVGANRTLAGLRSLTVLLSGDGIDHLTRAAHLEHLDRLQLEINGADQDDIAPLATSWIAAALVAVDVPWLMPGYLVPRLERLRWRALPRQGIEMEPEAAAALARHPRLDSLVLEHVTFDPAAVLSPTGPIRELRLVHCVAPEVFVRAIQLERLERLAALGADVDDAQIEVLTAGGHPRLAHLDLDHQPVGDRGLLALANCPALGALRSLRLMATRVTASGLAGLAARPLGARLHRLAFSGRGVTRDGVAALRSGRLDALRELDLDAIDDDTVAALGALREVAPSLRRITGRSAGLSEGGRAELLQRFAARLR